MISLIIGTVTGQNQYIFNKTRTGQSEMVQVVILYDAISDLVPVSMKEDSKVNCNVLKGVIHLIEKTLGEIFVSFSKLCSYTQEKVQQELLDGNEVYTPPSPAKYPDLNRKENVLGTLARSFYSYQLQSTSVQDSEETILQCWYYVSEDIYKRLYD